MFWCGGSGVLNLLLYNSSKVRALLKSKIVLLYSRKMQALLYSRIGLMYSKKVLALHFVF